MIRLTSRRLSAAAASATARNVLPVPAGPIPNVIVLSRIEAAYRFWLTVLGATLVVRIRQLADDRAAGVDRLLSAVEREDVAAQEPVAVEMSLERAQDAVL